MDDRLVRVADLGADGRAQAEAHAAEAAGSQELAGIVEEQALDGPHLVLAHVGGDHGAPGSHLLDDLADLLGGEAAVVVVIFGAGAVGKDLPLPLAVVVLGHSLVEQ